MKNIKVNYTNFEEKRTSTTIKFAIANIYYRESDLENFRKTIRGDRKKHIEAIRQAAQKFVNEDNKDIDDDTSYWEDQEMIEIAMIEESLNCSRLRTIEQMKAL